MFLVENYVVLHQIQQLGYHNSNLMLKWDSPFKRQALKYFEYFLKGYFDDAHQPNLQNVFESLVNRSLVLYHIKTLAPKIENWWIH